MHPIWKNKNIDIDIEEVSSSIDNTKFQLFPQTSW
jgi:hypothetical protein